MKKVILTVIVMVAIVHWSYGQVEVPYVAGAGPLGYGSLLHFQSGGSPTSIQENWGLNLCGATNQPIKVFNTSLLVGYQSGSESFGIGNAYISGNVGIGTTNPGYKLEIAGGTGGRGSMGNGSTGQFYEVIPYEIASHDNAGWSGTMFGVRTGGLNSASKPITQNVIANSPVYQQAWAMTFGTDKMATNGASFSLWTADATNPNTEMSEVFRIQSSGAVKAKQITVELTGWSDYVFKPSYQLKPLSEVKTYIDQNQHLPDVPSEQEMVKNGMNVGEMNKLLMKKVEELTLYLIQQKEETDKQKKSLQQQIDELKKQVDMLVTISHKTQ